MFLFKAKSFDTKMKILIDVTEWPPNHPQFLASFIFYLEPLRFEMIFQKKQFCTTIWISRTVDSIYSSFHSSCKDPNADASSFCAFYFCWSKKTWKNPGLKHPVLPGLYALLLHFTVLLFLSASRGDVTVGTKSKLGVQPFVGVSCCPIK